MSNYDLWKSTDPRDRIPEDEREEGCTCSDELGAGGVRKTDEWCPLHGRDPDAERERERDDDDAFEYMLDDWERE